MANTSQDGRLTSSVLCMCFGPGTILVGLIVCIMVRPGGVGNGGEYYLLAGLLVILVGIIMLSWGVVLWKQRKRTYPQHVEIEAYWSEPRRLPDPIIQQRSPHPRRDGSPRLLELRVTHPPAPRGDHQGRDSPPATPPPGISQSSPATPPPSYESVMAAQQQTR